MIFERVLIIDDEVDLGEAVRELLLEKFREVVFISDSKQALELLEQSHFDLILSDYKMPGLNGLELARKLGAAGNVTPVVWMSGYCDKAMAMNALRLGVLDIIEKPFDPDKIAKYVFRACEIERRKFEVQSCNEERKAQSKKILGLIFASDDRITTSRAAENSVTDDLSS